MRLGIRKAWRLAYRTTFRGLPISIEQAPGEARPWRDPDGDTGQTIMSLPYGYIRGTLGIDGDQLDVFVGPDESAPWVFVVTQMKPPDFREVDEEKCFLGFRDEADVRETYLRHYDDPRFLGKITPVPFQEFWRRAQATRQAPGPIVPPTPAPPAPTPVPVPTVALDFDGVLHAYHGWNAGRLGGPMPRIVALLKELRARQAHVVVYSTRDPVEIRAWLRRHGLDRWIDAVVREKPPAQAYLDDRAVTFTPALLRDPGRLAERLVRFRSHYGKSLGLRRGLRQYGRLGLRKSEGHVGGHERFDPRLNRTVTVRDYVRRLRLHLERRHRDTDHETLALQGDNLAGLIAYHRRLHQEGERRPSAPTRQYPQGRPAEESFEEHNQAVLEHRWVPVSDEVHHLNHPSTRVLERVLRRHRQGETREALARQAWAAYRAHGGTLQQFLRSEMAQWFREALEVDPEELERWLRA